jgi:2-oxoglutarate dehydrogenase E1 component
MATQTHTKLSAAPKTSKTPTNSASSASNGSSREATFDIFRRWGYLQASLDPLGQFLPPEPFPTPAADGPDAEEARGFYCSTIGAEFMHIPSPEKRAWIQARLETPYTAPSQARILSGLIRADIFEQVIQQRYLGTKRFSLEGLTVLIPFLDQLFTTAADNGVTRSLFAMAHRGRLNVMVNTVGRASHEIFTKFEDVDPRSTMGGGDVKYHMGATGDIITANGKAVHLHLASNPSHLEAVNPVIMGRARAWQERIEREQGPNAELSARQQVLPMVIHGDAAFAGQGVTAETLNVGGCIQVITNNLLGFTANPDESNSSRFASDLAKRLPIPIFHVNAEDPEAVARIAEIAADYRHAFASDVVVDLIGYRRHGHSEVDDPTVTQPRRYAKIKDHPALYKIYADRIGVDPTAEVTAAQNEFFEEQKAATQAEHKPKMHELPSYWQPFYRDRPCRGVFSCARYHFRA